jgi:hypothetical protein
VNFYFPFFIFYHNLNSGMRLNAMYSLCFVSFFCHESFLIINFIRYSANTEISCFMSYIYLTAGLCFYIHRKLFRLIVMAYI